jgi:hypothetical protein
MRAMSPASGRASSSQIASDPVEPRRRGSAWLVWIGMPLCVVGLVQHRLWEDWASGRFGELVILAALALALAWPLRRFAGLRWPSAIALVWCLALLPFAGVTPVLATAVLGLAALAVGGLIARHQNAVLQGLLGLVALGATVGWLLPLPLHNRYVYLAVCLGLIAWRWRALRSGIADLAESWRSRVDTAPRAAMFAVMMLGLAGTTCWIPTLQYDDIAYHLRLPWELVQTGRYAIDPSTHIWALAPWLGDVVQAIPQVIAGAEARGPVNALWLALAAAGVFQLTIALRGHARAAWMTVALFASLPLTAALAGGMQTELPTVAMLSWLAVLIARPARAGPSGMHAGGMLAGALIGLKFGAASSAVLLLPWAIARHGRSASPRHLLGALSVALLVGGSSYAYAWFVAGNPFLPLFGAAFPSPYLPAAVDDPRWSTGFTWSVLWDVTFDTHRYLEGFDGAAGFVLVALAGAFLLALSQRGLRAAAMTGCLLLIVPLTQIQYLRYAFPAIVMLLAVASVASLKAAPRTALWLLAGTCVLNIALQSNAQWMLRTGAMKQSFKAGGEDAPLFDEYAPERKIIALMRPSLTPESRVLALDPSHPFVAELGARGLSNAWYNPRFQARSRPADLDESGSAWAGIFRHERITDVIVRPGALTPGQRAGLALAKAEKRGGNGNVEWWRLPDNRSP